jgi:hypothetical protein
LWDERGCSGIAFVTADACSVAAADACPGTALAAASANCLRLNHSQTAVPMAPTAKSTAPATMDQLRFMICLAMLGMRFRLTPQSIWGTRLAGG